MVSLKEANKCAYACVNNGMYMDSMLLIIMLFCDGSKI